jgi:hypothetical protein
MVDLNLASSYVPAFVCLSKCVLCCLLGTQLIPIGGLSAMIVFLLLDRVFINSDFIVDVNSVVAAVLWSQVVAFERYRFGLKTPLHLLVCALWILVAQCQLCRPNFLKSRHELYLYALFSILISITFYSMEPITYTLLRTMGYNVTLLFQIYWQISMSVEEPLVLSILRHGSIIVAPPLFAIVASLTPMVFIAVRWNPVVNSPKEEIQDLEAMALREALANRKEKLSN